MPLVVSSLTGDASNVFDWVLSLHLRNGQSLDTLLQMLREHYCGSLTFCEQRNSIENLCQRPQEAAIDFLIRVGNSVINLGKDWKDELTEEELQSLQNEVSLNGVKEEIRHVLDSQMAKNDGKLTAHQMYEAVKKYKTAWPIIRGLKIRGPVPLVVNRRPQVIPQVTSLGFTRPLPLPLLLRSQRTILVVIRSPLLKRSLTPLRQDHL